MTYSIFDSHGNAIDAFDDRAKAIARLTTIVESEPGAADDVCMLTQDDDGAFTNDTVRGAEVLATLRAASAWIHR